jgi:hypothetical protein
MNAGQIVLLSTFLLSSAVMIACGVPLYCRRIGRNNWFGFRTKTTMSDDGDTASSSRLSTLDTSNAATPTIADHPGPVTIVLFGTASAHTMNAIDAASIRQISFHDGLKHD